MKTKSIIAKSPGEKIFNVCNCIFMIIMMLVMIYPLWHVLMASFSDPRTFSAHTGLLLRPAGFSAAAYKLMLNNPMILIGYKNTLLILAVGLALNMVVTSMAAYALSKRKPMLMKPLSILIIFTMYFSGGLIPGYLVVKDLGLFDTIWALVLPVTVSTFNLIVLRSGFESVPESLIEAAKIDGSSEMRVFLQIVLPLSKASLAVVVLYYAVSHWNAWFNAMLFISDRELFPLQLVLREILIQNDTSSMVIGVGAGDSGFLSETIKYAVIIVSVVPILCLYPFIQKYFAKGVMLGAVKG